MNKPNGHPYSATEEAQYIINDPTSFFGLAITSGGTFADADANSSGNTTTTIAGNAQFAQGGYRTTAVNTGNNTVPKMYVYLTYSNQFHTTVNGDVMFTLKEYNSQHQHQGDIDVTVTISTVLEELRSQEDKLLAMYNEMDMNTFVRKMVLPASLQRRDLYLTSIQWEQKDYADYFNLMPTTTSITDNNQFSLQIQPTEQVSSSLTNTLGWYTKRDTPVDVFATAKAQGTTYLYS